MFGTSNLIVLVSNSSASSKISTSTCRPLQLVFRVCALHGRSSVHTRGDVGVCTGEHVVCAAGRGFEILTHLALTQVAMRWLAVVFVAQDSTDFASANVSELADITMTQRAMYEQGTEKLFPANADILR